MAPESREEPVNDSQCEAFDGIDHKPFIDELGGHLDADASVLELGCGPGNDTRLLQNHFRVLSTDIKPSRMEPGAPRNAVADAREIAIPGLFQGIYSAKLLQLFSPADLERSAESQASKLETNGLLAHIIWNPERIGNSKNLLEYDELKSVFEKYGAVVFEKTYTTHIKNDTIGFMIQT